MISECSMLVLFVVFKPKYNESTEFLFILIHFEKEEEELYVWY